MRIEVYCGPSHEPFSPKSSEEGRGGSEEMVINMAKALAETNEVTVWNRCLDDEGVYDGVTYKNYDEFDVTETDIMIVWRSPQLYLSHKLDKVKGKKYLWLHDTVPQLDVLPYLFAYDGVFVLSEWHKSYYVQLCPPALRERFIVTRNAIHIPERREGVHDPYTVVYGSLYNRGLLELLSIWPQVKAEVPEAKLRVFYGWQTLEKLLPKEQFDEFKKKIDFLLEQDGITHLGRISHKEVEAEMLGAGIWAYPCLEFNEVSCITAMRAQVCGAVPVVIPRAALDETVKYGVKVLTATDAAHFLEKFKDALIKTLKDHKKQQKVRAEMMRETPRLFDFPGLVKQWEEIFLK